MPYLKEISPPKQKELSEDGYAICVVFTKEEEDDCYILMSILRRFGIKVLKHGSYLEVYNRMKAVKKGNAVRIFETPEDKVAFRKKQKQKNWQAYYKAHPEQAKLRNKLKNERRREKALALKLTKAG